MDFSFGSDPEFILRDRHGEARSAIGVVPGDRKSRLFVDGCEFFYDNVLAECTMPPAKARPEAVRNAGVALSRYAALVSPLRLTTEACCDFPESEVRHAEARRSGCEREYCAYSMSMVPDGKVRRAMRNGRFRTAGGHVHIGTAMGASHEEAVMLVRVLDLVLGLASIAMDSSKGARERRRLYGSPGRYRQPPHGLEYRTMGNFWLASPMLVGLVFDICRECVSLCEQGMHREFWRVDRERLESDDFWNSGGNPAECYECVAYDVALMRSLFDMEREEAMQRGKGLFEFAFSLLPPATAEQILASGEREYDMYEEWGLGLPTSSGPS